MASLLTDAAVLPVEKAKNLLANLRRRQLELAMSGKVEQSAEYARKANQVRQVLEKRLRQNG